MRSKKSALWRRLMRGLELPEQAVGSEEAIEILGGNTVVVEGAKGIHTYEKEVVKIDMKKYLLVLRGRDFELTRFGMEGLKVSGRLRQIEWEEK